MYDFLQKKQGFDWLLEDQVFQVYKKARYTRF
jgi:hypothetical protein